MSAFFQLVIGSILMGYFTSSFGIGGATFVLGSSVLIAINDRR